METRTRRAPAQHGRSRRQARQLLREGAKGRGPTSTPLGSGTRTHVGRRGGNRQAGSEHQAAPLTAAEKGSPPEGGKDGGPFQSQPGYIRPTPACTARTQPEKDPLLPRRLHSPGRDEPLSRHRSHPGISGPGHPQPNLIAHALPARSRTTNPRHQARRSAVIIPPEERACFLCQLTQTTRKEEVATMTRQEGWLMRWLAPGAPRGGRSRRGGSAAAARVCV